MTDMTGYRLSKKENITFHAVTVAAAIAVSYLLYRHILPAVVVLPFIPALRKMVSSALAERRMRRYASEFRDFLFMASTSIGAGRSMKDAVGEAIPSLENIHGKGCILAETLSVAYERMETGGESDIRVLTDMADASASEDVRDFVTIYAICKSTGASLVTALGKAAGVIIDKMTIEREIDELVRRKKSEGMLIFAMPAIVILFLNLTAPDYIAPLYETAAGRIIMTGTAASTAGIYVMIQKIIRVDI